MVVNPLILCHLEDTGSSSSSGSPQLQPKDEKSDGISANHAPKVVTQTIHRVTTMTGWHPQGFAPLCERYSVDLENSTRWGEGQEDVLLSLILALREAPDDNCSCCAIVDDSAGSGLPLGDLLEKFVCCREVSQCIKVKHWISGLGWHIPS